MNEVKSENVEQLFKAIKNKNTEEIGNLISRLGGYVNEKRSPDGAAPLHAAARTGNIEILKLFTNAPSVNVSIEDHNGLTPLHYILERKNLDGAKLLIDAGADINARDNRKNTPLNYVLSKKNVNFKTIEWFLNFRPDVNIENRSGITPLWSAIEGDKFDVAKLLIDHGSDVNSIDPSSGSTSLHAAVDYYKMNDIELIKSLLKNGANANALDFNGQTPLIYSFSKRFCGYIVKPKQYLNYLLNYSDVNIVDRKKRNILDASVTINDQKIILKYIAKLQALNLPVIPSIINTISISEELSIFFVECKEELNLARTTKLKDCWVTFFNLLFDNKKKLKNYAGNQDLINDFKKTDFTNKFPIYGDNMQIRMGKGIKRRKLFDRSSITLSNHVPLFNPNHLIIRDIFDCLATSDLSKFCY